MRVRFLVSLIAAGVAVGLVITGCGGGGNQQDDQSQGSNAEQTKQERTGGGKKKEAATKMESLAGIVLKTFPDKPRILVRPKNGERQVFTYNPDKVKVTLDGEEAGPEAIDKGQRVRVGYTKVTTKKERKVDVARSIRLQSQGSSTGGETTG